MTSRGLLARAARLCAVCVAPLLALAAAPAAAQTQCPLATVYITSTPANGEYYRAGEAITTRLIGVRGRNVHQGATGVGSTAPLPFNQSHMDIEIGGVTREAGIPAGITTSSDLPNNQTVDFTYTVVAADLDTDGVSIPANSIGGTGWGNICRDHAALPAQAAHKVQGMAASIGNTSPSPLDETNLDGASVAVALYGGVTFESGVTASSFELVTTMTGVSISGLATVMSGDTAAELTLSSTADISSDATLAVRVLAAAHSGNADLTTGAVRVAPVAALSAGPGASVSARSVAVEEGSTGFWDVTLSADPGAGCTGGVTIGITSGDTAAVTVSPASLTFTSADWNMAQTVTATGVQDGDLADETAAISHMVTATGCATTYPTGLSIAGVTVSVEDDDMSLFSIDSPRVVEGRQRRGGR